MYFYIYNTDHAQCAGKTEINKKVGTKENTVRMAIRARYNLGNGSRNWVEKKGCKQTVGQKHKRFGRHIMRVSKCMQ